MYVLPKSAAQSCIRCCSEKSMSITYSESVCLALGIQHAMRMSHVFICGLPRSTKFLHISHKRYDFKKKKKVMEHKMFFRFSLQLLSETFYILRRTD